MDNMTSRHKLIAVLVLAVLYFGSTGVSQYLKSRDVDLETRQLISAGVKEQKILADAMEKSFQVGTIAAHSDVAYNAVLKHSGDVKNIKINDVQIKRSEIDRIRATTRRSSTTIEFNDTFIILNVDPSTPDGFVVKVKSRSDGIEFRAIIYDGKTSPYTRKAIQQAEWGKTTIRLVISARQIGDQIVDARIVKALPTASKGLLVRQHKRYL